MGSEISKIVYNGTPYDIRDEKTSKELQEVKETIPNKGILKDTELEMQRSGAEGDETLFGVDLGKLPGGGGSVDPITPEDIDRMLGGG